MGNNYSKWILNEKLIPSGERAKGSNIRLRYWEDLVGKRRDSRAFSPAARIEDNHDNLIRWIRLDERRLETHQDQFNFHRFALRSSRSLRTRRKSCSRCCEDDANLAKTRDYDVEELTGFQKDRVPRGYGMQLYSTTIVSAIRDTAKRHEKKDKFSRFFYEPIDASDKKTLGIHEIDR